MSEPHLLLLVPLRRLAANESSLEKRLSDALTGEMALAIDLPVSFLMQWPQQTGVHWLLLLDTLDEVLYSERGHLLHGSNDNYHWLQTKSSDRVNRSFGLELRTSIRAHLVIRAGVSYNHLSQNNFLKSGPG